MANFQKLNRDVIIVGGGPAGLFLGLCLAHFGVDFVILESRLSTHTHSRSIGIHPPSLAKMHHLGVFDALVRAGVQIKKGIAMNRSGPLGELDFSSAGLDFPFVLALPQYQTETILQERLLKVKPGCIRRGVKNVIVKSEMDGAIVSWEESSNSFFGNAAVVAACDGKNSSIREQLRIPFEGGSYRDTYVMGDFPDTTDWPQTAVIFLDKDGLVESFPLPGGWRRWVVKTDEMMHEITAQELSRLVFNRTRCLAEPDKNRMISPFGVQHLVAKTFSKGRIALVGDAAHIISPIGGQGMNLGWMDGWHLARSISEARASDYAKIEQELAKYSKIRRQNTLVAMNSAYINMALGRKYRYPLVRDGIVSFLLKPVLREAFIRRFTMSGLEK
jgi:2-polyprenyl-6-methoxyphenol hydroxylase-like FAD-dependent oxidoreductase